MLTELAPIEDARQLAKSSCVSSIVSFLLRVCSSIVSTVSCAAKCIAAEHKDEDDADDEYCCRHEHPVVLDDAESSSNDSLEKISIISTAPHVLLQVVPQREGQDEQCQVEHSLRQLKSRIYLLSPRQVALINCAVHKVRFEDPDEAICTQERVKVLLNIIIKVVLDE